MFVPFFNVKRHYALRTHETSHPGTLKEIHRDSQLNVWQIGGLRSQVCGFVIRADKSLLVNPGPLTLGMVPSKGMKRHGPPSQFLELPLLWGYRFRCGTSYSCLLIHRIKDKTTDDEDDQSGT